MGIHPTAVVSPKAEIGADVEIGPYAIVEDNVVVGDGCRIDAHSKIGRYSTLGPRCRVHFNALIGDEPQDHSFDSGVKSYTEIGHDSIIREFVTIHRSPKEEFKTIIGSHCMVMGFCHIAHDVILGDRVTLVNHTALSGHVQIETGAIVSGYNMFHQFCRVGTLAMVGPGNKLNLDIPPYCLLGEPGVIYGPNTIGLRRAGFKAEKRAALRRAIKTYFFKPGPKRELLDEIESEEMCPEVQHFVDFIKASKRGICPISPKHFDNQD